MRPWNSLSEPADIIGVGVDLVVGLAATVLGVLLVYVLARPRFTFAPAVTWVSGRSGARLYRVQLRSRSLLPIVETTVSVSVRIPMANSSVSVTVPIRQPDLHFWKQRRRHGTYARDEWFAPRLRLEQVQWAESLPTGMRVPATTTPLDEILGAWDAELVVSVHATSEVFQVSTVARYVYRANAFAQDDGLDIQHD